MSGDVVIACSVGAVHAVGQPARVATRTNFSVPLLAGAARSAREAFRLETTHAGQPYGEFVFELMQCVPAAVTNAFAALESYVNELGADCIEHWGKKHDHALLREVWPLDDRRERTLEKMRAAYTCSGLEVDPARRPWQPIEALAKLRNALVHFRPEWSDEVREHRALSRKLEPWIKGSPFFAETELLFPRRFVSHSCAEWAVGTVRDLILDFEERSGVRPTIKPNLKFFATQ